MEIKRTGTQPSTKGPADWFTGTVWIDPLFQPTESRRAAGVSVTFESGARTAWHPSARSDPHRHRRLGRAQTWGNYFSPNSQATDTWRDFANAMAS